MDTLVLEITAMLVIVWAATEGLGAVFKLRKEIFAMILGPVTVAVAWWAGYVTVGEGAAGFVMAVLMGFLLSVTTGVVHDKIANPLIKTIGSGGGN